MPITNTEIEELSRVLFEGEPDQDPESVHLENLRSRVLALPEFRGEPEKLNRQVLDAIREAWIEAFRGD